MKKIIIASALFLTACGDDPVTSDTVNPSNSVLTEALLYPDDGISNRLFSCNEAAQRIRDGIELGMTFSQVRAIVGKPRHISPIGNDWRYGTDAILGDGSTPDRFFTFDEIYRQPVTNFNTIGVDSETGDLEQGGNQIFGNTFLDDFSGDNTFCDDTDLSFIEAANSYAETAGNIDFSDEITSCSDAAVRIAGAVEQGMSQEQARQLVGKPVEVAQDGTVWRYDFNQVSVPFIIFTRYLNNDTYFVTGYSSISDFCLDRGLPPGAM